MRKIWINKSKSFKDAEAFDRNYHLSMSPAERITEMQRLREMEQKMKKGSGYARSREGLRRFIKIVQPA